MSATLAQIFALNPTTTIGDNDLMYLVQSPYTPGTDAGILGSSLKALFVSSTAIINVAHGGTGKSSFTPFSVITGGTSSGGALQNVVGVGVSGQVLTSNGAGLLPSWQSSVITGQPLTKTDDTNVTLTLGGAPATALVNAASLTLGWTGQLSVPRGGTGNSTFTAFSVICAGTTTTGAFQNVVGIGTAGQVLTSNGAGLLPSWQSNPNGVVNPGLINQLAWYAASGSTVSGLATANNGVLITSAGGVPSISSTLPTAVQGNITSLGTITSGVWNGTAIDETHGGTNQTTYTLGDTLYASAANTLSKLPGNITAVKQYLSQTGTGVISAAPAWATISGTDITGAALTKTDDTNVTLTLGGSPTTALLRATSLTLGWTGQLSVARGGTGNSTFTAFSVITAGTTATGAFQNVSGVGTTGQVLTSNGAGTLPTWQASTITGQALTKTDDTNVTLTLGGSPTTALVNAASLTLGWTGTLSVARGGTGVAASDPVIQRVSTQTGTVNTGTTILPFDNTIPQITEGNEYMTLAITPKNTANILRIDVVCFISNNNAGGSANGAALFQDATSNALAAANAGTSTTQIISCIKFTHTMTAGTTSSTTFRVRAGGSAAGTTTFNGSNGAGIYGGVMASSIVITEYAT